MSGTGFKPLLLSGQLVCRMSWKSAILGVLAQLLARRVNHTPGVWPFCDYEHGGPPLLALITRGEDPRGKTLIALA